MTSRRSRPRRPPSNKKRSSGPARKPARDDSPRQEQSPAVPDSPPTPESAEPRRGRVFRKVETLVKAVWAKNDPVDVATDLLQESGDATKAKVFLQLLEYQYGKPVPPVDASEPAEEKVAFQFVSNIPRPDYSTAAWKANASSTTAPAPAGASRTSSSESTKEEKHE